MNIRIIFLSLIFLSGNSYAITYCVDPAGIGDTGCDNVVQTIAEVNALPLVAGDNVLFKRGEVWRETLIVPSSGVAGSPITFGAYGITSDPKPLISCANNITNELWEGVIPNGGFEQAVIDQGVTSFPGWKEGLTILSQEPGNGSPNSIKLKVPEGSGAGGIKTVPWHMEQDVQYTISGSIKAVTPDTKIEVILYNSEPDNFKYLDSEMNWQTWDPSLNGTGSGTRQPFFSTTVSNWADFDLPFVGIAGTNVFINIRIIGTSLEGLADNIRIKKVGSDYWSVPRGSFAPKILIEDGIRLAYGVEWDESYQWHRVGSASAISRYIPPAGSLPSNHLVEIGTRRVAILLDSKEHITIDNIEVEGCEPFVSGTSTQEGAGILLANGSSNNTISNVLAINNDAGIRVEGAGSNGEWSLNNVFTNFEVAHSISQGIALRNFSSGNTIQNCKVHDLAGLDSDDVNQDKEGISIGGTTGNGPGNVIEYCEVYNIGLNVNSRAGAIPVFNSPGTLVRYNYVHDIGRNAIIISSNDGPDAGLPTPGFTSSDSEIYYNIIARTGLSLNSSGQGVVVGAGPFANNSNIKVYNNTIVDCVGYDNKDAGLAIRSVALQCTQEDRDNNGDCPIIQGYEDYQPVFVANGWYYRNVDGDYIVGRLSNLVIKNNIISACTGSRTRALFVGTKKNIGGAVDVINPDINHNLYNPGANAGSDILIAFGIGVGGLPKEYTIDQFGPIDQMGTYLYDANLVNPGQDSMSSVVDPLFTDPMSDDFHIQIDSPASNAGSNDPELNLNRDQEGNQISNTPDIGAYEYVDTDGDDIQDYVDDDKDGDGLLNDDEENIYGTDPLNSDTDGDGVNDGTEVTNGTNPLLIDTDRDMVGDSTDSAPVDLFSPNNQGLNLANDAQYQQPSINYSDTDTLYILAWSASVGTASATHSYTITGGGSTLASGDLQDTGNGSYEVQIPIASLSYSGDALVSIKLQQRKNKYIAERTITITGDGNAAPTVSIATPTGGASFASGESISFSGSASDVEDGELTSSLNWTSDIDGAIGSGGSFTATLTDGSHTITASVTDSGGKTTNTSISITAGTMACSIYGDKESCNAVTACRWGGGRFKSCSVR